MRNFSFVQISKFNISAAVYFLVTIIQLFTQLYFNTSVAFTFIMDKEHVKIHSQK